MDDEIGNAIKSGEAHALHDRIRVAGVSDSPFCEEEYEPVTLSFSEASWVMDMIIEVEVNRNRKTPLMADGQRDKLLLRMARCISDTHKACGPSYGPGKVLGELVFKLGG